MKASLKEKEGVAPLVVVLVPFVEWNQLVAECVSGCLVQNYVNFRLCLLPNERDTVPDQVAADPRVSIIATGLSDISRKRNHAIAAHPQADFYACIDSDAVPPPEWLQNGTSAFSRSRDIGLVGGPDISPAYADIMQQAVKNALSIWLVSGDRAFMKKLSADRFTDDLRTANCIIKREVIEDVGMFDEDLPVGEDSGLCLKARRSGWTLWFDRGVVVRHQNRRLFGPFLRQRIIAGYGVPFLVRKYPDMALHAWALRLAPLGMILYLLLGWISIEVNRTIFNAWATGVVLYFLAVLIGAVNCSAKVREIPLTAAAIIIGNLGPGLGILVAAFGKRLKIASFYRNRETQNPGHP